MEWELLETRTISGKGIFKIADAKKKNRAYVLYSNVIRNPTNPYLNKNWNPPKGKYASMCFMYQGQVLDSCAIEFDGQCFTGINDISGQTLIALKCAYEGMLVSFRKLADLVIASNPVLLATAETISTTDTIKDYENLRLTWDEIRVQCYGDTALQFKLYRLQYDTCDPLKDKDKPPPPPPSPPPKQPPGQKIDIISPPYEPGQDPTMGDNNNTEPAPIDKPTPPPPTPPGQATSVTLVATYVYGNQTGQHYTIGVNVVTPYYVVTNGRSYVIAHSPRTGGGEDVTPMLSVSDDGSTVWFTIDSLTDALGYQVDLRTVP